MVTSVYLRFTHSFNKTWGTDSFTCFATITDSDGKTENKKGRYHGAGGAVNNWIGAFMNCMETGYIWSSDVNGIEDFFRGYGLKSAMKKLDRKNRPKELLFVRYKGV